MSQHQQAFSVDKSTEVDRVARHVLTVLAAGQAPLPVEPAYCSRTLSAHFYDAVLQADPKYWTTAMFELQAKGMADSVIAFEMIPYIARRLGHDWEHDRISFADVTIGCARLQIALRQLDDTPDVTIGSLPCRRQNFLVMVPQGSQHTLGAVVLAKQLRKAGVGVRLELETGHMPIVQLDSQQQIDGVMISAAKGENLENLCRLVAQSRKNWPKAKIFLGGGVTDNASDLVALTRTDYVTNDWQAALQLCQ